MFLKIYLYTITSNLNFFYFLRLPDLDFFFDLDLLFDLLFDPDFFEDLDFLEDLDFFEDLVFLEDFGVFGGGFGESGFSLLLLFPLLLPSLFPLLFPEVWHCDCPWPSCCWFWHCVPWPTCDCPWWLISMVIWLCPWCWKPRLSFLEAFLLSDITSASGFSTLAASTWGFSYDPVLIIKCYYLILIILAFIHCLVYLSNNKTNFPAVSKLI